MNKKDKKIMNKAITEAVRAAIAGSQPEGRSMRLQYFDQADRESASLVLDVPTLMEMSVNCSNEVAAFALWALDRLKGKANSFRWLKQSPNAS